jgi:hypothetical protein
MNLKTFGTTDPTGDANPTSARANPLAVDKKAVSFFMPNRDKWSATRMEGNPTQSMQVNSLIKRVRKKEARKQGVKSQAQRPILGQEFVALHDELLNQHDGRRRNGNQGGRVYWKRYGITTMVNFQFHLIARVDDTTQLVLEHICVHDNFPKCLKTRLNWSKNVNDEQDAPWQIVLGSINSVYCVLSLLLALWLELNLKSNPMAMSSPYVFCTSDDIRMPEGGLKSKAMIQNALKVMFKGEQFKCAEEEEEAASMLLGSHSVQKYAATYAQRCGVSKDEKDTRGRWKGQGSVWDIYDDVELPNPDAKVAEKLCGGGGPCFYLCNPTLDVAMMNLFVLNHVVPNIKKQLPESACLVLGKALLWLIFSSVVDQYVLEDLKQEWEHVRCDDVDAELNPIRQMAVVVSGDHGVVYIDVIGNLEEENAGGGGVVPGTNTSI